MVPSSGYTLTVLLGCQLQIGQPLISTSCLVLTSYARGVFPCLPGPLHLSSDWLKHFTQDCRSFTWCQEKAWLKGGGQASHTVPHRPRWGEWRPFTTGLGYSQSVCCGWRICLCQQRLGLLLSPLDAWTALWFNGCLLCDGFYCLINLVYIQ